MAEDTKPDEDAQDEEAVSKETPSEPLSDEDVSKLFANISEEAAKAPEGDDDNDTPDEEPKADSPPATFDPAMLQTPEGQKAIRDAVNTIAASQKTEADTEAQRQELQKLIADGNFEELGKRYTKSLETQQAGQGAVDTFLTTFYRNLFSDELFQNLTVEERKEIEPDGRFQTDADYVRHLSKFMANKLKSGISNEDLNAAVAERIEALRRSVAGDKARKGSVQGASPAEGGSSSSPTDARSLISEGLKETFPEAYAE